MGSITVKVPDELDETIEESGLNWSKIASRAIFEKARKLKRLQELSSKIDISEEKEEELVDEIKRGVYERYKKEL